MANRLNRDEIVHRALDMTDSPSLDQKERPDGVNITGLLGVRFLQDGLDLFHTKFPMAGTLKSTTLSWIAGQLTYSLPADFIQEYRNGIVYNTASGDRGRMFRCSLDQILTWEATAALQTGTKGQPRGFAILSNTTIRIYPTPDRGYTVDLWYYGLPAVLGQTQIPSFPSDWILAEFVHYRYREWLQQAEPGTAIAYAVESIKNLVASGISVEPEPTDIPMDPWTFRTGGEQEGGWMGPSVPR